VPEMRKVSRHCTHDEKRPVCWSVGEEWCRKVTDDELLGIKIVYLMNWHRNFSRRLARGGGLARVKVSGWKRKLIDAWAAET